MKALVFALLWLLPSQAASQSTQTEVLPPWQTGEVTPDGTCAGADAFVCSPTWGACCSEDGLCGRSNAFCGDGCQSGFGNCNVATAPAPGPGSPSNDGSCGGTNQFTCNGTTFGACCSANGFCGNTAAHCAIGGGCQSLFGTCSAANNITSDGSCGSNGKICLESGFGNCCSSNGFCGDSTTHCGPGCQVSFGNCTSADNQVLEIAVHQTVSVVQLQATATRAAKRPLGFVMLEWEMCQLTMLAGRMARRVKAQLSEIVAQLVGSVAKRQITAVQAAKLLLGLATLEQEMCQLMVRYCGSTATHCGVGCQKPSSSACLTTNIPSVDGTCGASKGGLTCAGGAFNNQCCSSGGFCGTTTAHCASGCQKGYGRSAKRYAARLGSGTLRS
ncbi:keratin-associated protein 5-4 [Sclerotinia borealis F-4128]|uniref:Keratin-associated protein 5-4 n=1 Tax=Sclerotinia borealis (strain F-4128) TaxID=1432307 RepID=W9CTL4_SCLBF|nr:keratin-associated protein 5-4 [Sclerotinia borealis F-4128]